MSSPHIVSATKSFMSSTSTSTTDGCSAVLLGPLEERRLVLGVLEAGHEGHLDDLYVALGSVGSDHLLLAHVVRDSGDVRHAVHLLWTR